MPIGDRGWSDRQENYADAYTLLVVGTTATAINSSGDSPYKLQPIVLYSVTVTVNPAVGSGDIALIDGTASADSGDARLFRCNVASAAASVFEAHFPFPRGMVFDKGIIVSATTITGAINMTYKNRYS